MKVKAEISMDIPRSLYCSKQNGELCKYVSAWESTSRQRYCQLYQQYLPKTNDGLLVKCEKCMLNLRYKIIGKGC